MINLLIIAAFLLIFNLLSYLFHHLKTKIFILRIKKAVRKERDLSENYTQIFITKRKETKLDDSET